MRHISSHLLVSGGSAIAVICCLGSSMSAKGDLHPTVGWDDLPLRSLLECGNRKQHYQHKEKLLCGTALREHQVDEDAAHEQTSQPLTDCLAPAFNVCECQWSEPPQEEIERAKPLKPIKGSLNAGSETEHIEPPVGFGKRYYIGISHRLQTREGGYGFSQHRQGTFSATALLKDDFSHRVLCTNWKHYTVIAACFSGVLSLFKTSVIETSCDCEATPESIPITPRRWAPLGPL
jgi:hypothetical protein